MRYYNELGIEIKSGLIFSVIAFVLSIAAGLMGSVPLGMIILRSLVVIPLFFLVGFGVFIVVKKFVPEVYEVLSNFNGRGEDDSVEDVDISSSNSDDVEGEYSDTGEDAENREEDFTEFKEADFEKVHTTNSSGINTVFDTSGGKLGKHIVVDKALDGFGYEPKIMAEAIRTMMSKDKD